MKFVRWAILLLSMVPFLAGCGNFWQAPSSSTTTTTTTLSSGYFYIIDQTDSELIFYSIDTGVLTKVAVVAVPGSPYAVTVAPNNKFLYVSTANGIYLYTISTSNGTPTLYSSTVITSDPATAMQVDSTNKWLLEASAQGYLYAIPITADTGALSGSTTQHVALGSETINQLVIAPNNEYVFLAEGTNGTQAFTFTASSSIPLGISAYKTIAVAASTSSAGAALSVAVNPGSSLLFIGETNAYSGSGGLRAFTLDSSSGALSELSDSPYSSGGTGPYGILSESTGDYVYVANWNETSSGNITGFTISSSALTELSSSVSTGAKPMALVEDSLDHFVLVVSAGGSPYLGAYYFDTTTSGQLDLAASSSTYSAIGIAAQH